MEPKERLARQNEVATTLDNIDALDTDQLRAVLRGFVVDDVAFEPEQLTMLSIVLSETRHKTGATKVGSYDAMALFGRRETALSQSRINWSAKQEARYEAAKKVQSEMDSTDPPELTKDQWVQIQRELRGEIVDGSGRQEVADAFAHTWDKHMGFGATSTDQDALSDSSDTRSYATCPTSPEAAFGLRPTAPVSSSDAIDLALGRRIINQGQLTLSCINGDRPPQAVKSQAKSVNGERTTIKPVKNKNKWVKCRNCTKRFREKDNSEGSCRYHTSKVKVFTDENSPRTSFRGEAWKCCRRKPKAPGCRSTIHVE